MMILCSQLTPFLKHHPAWSCQVGEQLRLRLQVPLRTEFTQKETPRQRQGGGKLFWKCWLISTPRVFSPHIWILCSGIWIQPVVTSGMNGTSFGYTWGGWFSSQRFQLLTPSKDPIDVRGFFIDLTLSISPVESQWVWECTGWTGMVVDDLDYEIKQLNTYTSLLHLFLAQTRWLGLFSMARCGLNFWIITTGELILEPIVVHSKFQHFIGCNASHYRIRDAIQFNILQLQNRWTTGISGRR